MPSAPSGLRGESFVRRGWQLACPRRESAELSVFACARQPHRAGACASTSRYARPGKLAGAVGLDLSVRTYPGASPIRDAAQVLLLKRAVERFGPDWRWRFEVPVAGDGDQRAWDAAAQHRLTGTKFVLDAETRIRDVAIGRASDEPEAARLGWLAGRARRIELETEPRRDSGVRRHPPCGVPNTRAPRPRGPRCWVGTQVETRWSCCDVGTGIGRGRGAGVYAPVRSDQRAPPDRLGRRAYAPSVDQRTPPDRLDARRAPRSRTGPRAAPGPARPPGVRPAYDRTRGRPPRTGSGRPPGSACTPRVRSDPAGGHRAPARGGRPGSACTPRVRSDPGRPAHRLGPIARGSATPAGSRPSGGRDRGPEAGSPAA